MRIRRLYPGSFGANCWLLLSRDGQAAVVDPSPDARTILDTLREEHACASVILLTHGHFDHILSLDTLREAAGIPALIHREDLDLPSDAQKNAFAAFFRQRREWKTPDGVFEDGATLHIGEESITVLHTPGHTRGSVCFLVNGGQDILTGDTLFDGSYGRCDLWGGDAAVLHRSLVRLSKENPDARIHPGHGDDARLGDALEMIGII